MHSPRASSGVLHGWPSVRAGYNLYNDKTILSFIYSPNKNLQMLYADTVTITQPKYNVNNVHVNETTDIVVLYC